MSARIWTRSFASRFESGSSIRNTAGSRTIARPIATRCRWPPESARGFRFEVRLEVEDPRRVVDAAADLVLRHLRDLQRERDVVANAQVRVERVALEDHRDVAALRREVVDDTVADPDDAVADVLEAGDHPQRGRLAAPGRADEHHELAVGDLAGRACRRRACRPRRRFETSSNSTLAIAHSFTAPPTRPRTSARCEKTKTIATGTTAIKRRERELGLEDVDRLAAAADRRVERRRRGEQVPEADRDRVLVRVREDDVRQEEVVPVGDEAEEEDERDDRLRERQRDAEERLQLACSRRPAPRRAGRVGARSRSRGRRGRRRTGRTRTAGSPRARSRSDARRSARGRSAARARPPARSSRRASARGRASGPGTCRSRGRTPPGRRPRA